MGLIYAVVNQKGGVGKTTTAVNLSAELGAAGRNILLVDLDPQANATSGVGHGRDDREKNIYRVLMGKLRLEEVISSTGYQGLDLVPSHPDLTGAEVEMVNMLGREFILRDTLSPVLDRYDCVIIDCPPSLNILVVNALVACNHILLPIQCEYYALEGLSLLMNTISLVRERLNPGLTLEGVILTMADNRTRLSGQVDQEVRRHLGARVFETVIPRNVRLGEAPSFGKPILYYDASSRGAEAYGELAREMISRSPGLRTNPIVAGSKNMPDDAACTKVIPVNNQIISGGTHD